MVYTRQQSRENIPLHSFDKTHFQILKKFYWYWLCKCFALSNLGNSLNVLLSYRSPVFWISGFPRCWSSYIYLDVSYWWFGTYTYKSRSCDCCWSCLKSNVCLEGLQIFYNFVV